MASSLTLLAMTAGMKRAFRAFGWNHFPTLAARDRLLFADTLDFDHIGLHAARGRGAALLAAFSDDERRVS